VVKVIERIIQQAPVMPVYPYWAHVTNGVCWCGQCHFPVVVTWSTGSGYPATVTYNT
jgi:hypothetical protein